MARKNLRTSEAIELRKKAEKIAGKNDCQSPAITGSLSPEETLRTLHELHVHQIELEMQNESLRQIQAELETARTRYFDLYDLAPVGYCALSEQGLILEANLTATNMLGIDRKLLARQSFAAFIFSEDQSTYYRLNINLKKSRSESSSHVDLPQSCELRMVKNNGAIFWALLEASITQINDNNFVFRIVLNDITERKQAEVALQRAHDELEHRVMLRTDELRQANEALQADIAVRKQTEEELRESESRYRELFGAESDAIVLIDNATGEILDANVATEAMYGYDHAELLTKRNTDLSAEPEETQPVTHGKPVDTDDIITIPVRLHKKKDGTVFSVEIKARFFVWKGHSVHLAAIRDITERKRNEDIMQARFRLSEYSVNHSLDELLQCTLDEAELLTRSNIGFFHFVEKDQNTLQFQAWSTKSIETLSAADGKGQHYDVNQAGAWTDCLRQRCPVIHNDYAGLPHRNGLPSGHALVYRELLIPIIRGELVVAILGVGNKQQDYDGQDIETLMSLANLAWDIIERKQGQEALAIAAERDHHIAEVFQKTVMPPNLPDQPPGYEIATKYQPASKEADVCGDFCDIFNLGDGCIGISIGDIVGKGLLAAMRVTAAKNMIRSYAFLYDRPSKVMTLVNDALCRDIAMENDMLTAFFAVLDTKTGILTYSNAGHEPPLLQQVNGNIRLLNVGGPMFCGLGKQVYLEGYLSLQAGDVFVTVTDGITEAGADRCSDMFGADSVINCLSESANASAELISATIMENAIKFANGPLRDDAAVVVIKKTEETAQA